MKTTEQSVEIQDLLINIDEELKSKIINLLDDVLILSRLSDCLVQVDVIKNTFYTTHQTVIKNDVSEVVLDFIFYNSPNGLVFDNLSIFIDFGIETKRLQKNYESYVDVGEIEKITNSNKYFAKYPIHEEGVLIILEMLRDFIMKK